MKTKEKIIEKAIAEILRLYSMYEYINFVSRSNASKGTTNWSDYVAKFLLKQKGTLQLERLLSQQKQEMVEEKIANILSGLKVVESDFVPKDVVIISKKLGLKQKLTK